MAKRLRVKGGLTFSGGHQLRRIVATDSKKKAAQLLGTSLYSFNQYWSETGNATERDLALSKPGAIFIASTSMGDDFIEDVKKEKPLCKPMK